MNRRWTNVIYEDEKNHPFNSTQDVDSAYKYISGLGDGLLSLISAPGHLKIYTGVHTSLSTDVFVLYKMSAIVHTREVGI